MRTSLSILFIVAQGFQVSLVAQLSDTPDPRFNPVGNPGFSIVEPGSWEKPPVVQNVEGRPRMGVSSKDASGGGIEVTEVTPGGPAAQAGIRSGDILVRIDGQSFANGAEYAPLRDKLQSTQVAELTFRRLGQEMSAKVKLAATEGESTAAWDAGLRPGDVILSYGGQTSPTAYDFTQIAEGYAAGEAVEVKYRRGGEERTTTFKPSFYSSEIDGGASFKFTPGSGHGSAIQDALVSPARREAVTYDQDGVFIVWGVDDMKPKKRFILPSGFGRVQRAVLARDGRMLGLICTNGVRRSSLVVDLDRLDIAAFLAIPENRQDFKFSEIAVAPDSSTAVCVQNLWDPKTLPGGETRLFLFDLAKAGLLDESAPAGVKKPAFLSGQQILVATGTGTNPVYQGQAGLIAVGVSDGTVRQLSVTRNPGQSPEVQATRTFSFLKSLPSLSGQMESVSPTTVIAPGNHKWRGVIQSWLQPRFLASHDQGYLVVGCDQSYFRLSPTFEVTHWVKGPLARRDYVEHDEREQMGLVLGAAQSASLSCSPDGIWYGISKFSFNKMSTFGLRLNSTHLLSAGQQLDIEKIASSVLLQQQLFENYIVAGLGLPGRTWDESRPPKIVPLSDTEAVIMEANMREILLVRTDLSRGALADDSVTGSLVVSNRQSAPEASLFDIRGMALSEDETVLAAGPEFAGLSSLERLFRINESKNTKARSGKVPKTTAELAKSYESEHSAYVTAGFTSAPSAFLQLVPAPGRVLTEPGKQYYTQRRAFGDEFVFDLGIEHERYVRVYATPLKIDDSPNKLLELAGRVGNLQLAMSSSNGGASKKSQEMKALLTDISKYSEANEALLRWKKLLPFAKDFDMPQSPYVTKITSAAEPCWVLYGVPADERYHSGTRSGYWRTSLNGDGGRQIVSQGFSSLTHVASKDGLRLFVCNQEARRIDLYGTMTPEYLASAYVFEGGEWVWWTPEGFFAASPKAIEWIGWSTNQGLAHPAKYFTGEQMFNHFNRPDILSEVINKGTPASQVAKRLGLKFELSAILRGVPMVELIGIKDGGKMGAPTISIQVKATEMGGGIHNLEFFHNGKRLVPDGPAIRGERDQTRSFTVNFQPGKNELRAVAYNEEKIMSIPATAVVEYDGATATSTLHVLTVGVNRYQNARYNLNYCVADSEALLAAFEERGRGIFKEIKQHRVIDAQATRPNIQAEFQKIAATAEPQDMFLFVFAGHGVMSETPESKEPVFHLVTHDVTRLYGDAALLAEKAISAKQLEEWSAAIKAQKQLMLLDTCQSGGLVDTYAMRGAAEEKAIAQLSRATGTTVIASTGTEQYASEVKALGHGIFTYAILKALEKGEGDGNKDGRVTVKELEAYVNDIVPELTLKHNGTAQYPNSYSRGQDFPIGIIK